MIVDYIIEKIPYQSYFNANVLVEVFMYIPRIGFANILTWRVVFVFGTESAWPVSKPKPKNTTKAKGIIFEKDIFQNLIWEFKKRMWNTDRVCHNL